MAEIIAETTESVTGQTEHAIEVAAPAATVYRLLAEVENWPQLFPPTIFADYLDNNEREQRIRIWATAGEGVKHWVSRRVLDPERRRIEFRQEVSSAPIAAMGGTWIVDTLPDDRSHVRLLHDYRAVAADKLSWIDEVVDRNSRTELAALKRNIELGDAGADSAFSFEDTVEVQGAAEDVFGFISDAQLWPERLPHVAGVELTEPGPGMQSLAMDTVAIDGSQHRTMSYRIVFPHHKIAYKQITMPALMTLHTGYWTVRPHERGVSVSSQHSVVVNTDNIAAVLGPDADLTSAKAYVQRALSTNSLATLRHAKQYAEAGS
ncbi:MAG: bifunctional cyclase or dehydrase [Nocardia sp.]|uniref:aromatase/cyclase n=1 Tax=Nocardia sp. TaxID=1821 RepID=UPI0026362DAA|nr:aromatase/cyclase [Nocardia sp.]MCU1641949.1 bifunctional cyclase or dehydrase [Nocardia sp.]